MVEPQTTTHEKETPERLVFGIDIGGTNVKIGIVSSRGETIATESVPTGKLDNPQELGRVRDAILSLATDNNIDIKDISGIGVDIPGVVLADGTLSMAPNISLDFEGLLNTLKAALPHAVLVSLNDANSAALGETWIGAGGGVDSLAMLTLGTGVGGGIVIGGRIVVGANGAGGEVGHMCVNYDETEACTCGLKGCLEQYASARGLIKLYREACAKDGAEEIEIAHASDALSVFIAARTGNDQAVAACQKLGMYLGRALAAIATVVNPHVFVIGGGMCGGWDTFGEDCLAAYREFALPDCRETPILPATLGNTAGFLGAARQALIALEDKDR